MATFYTVSFRHAADGMIHNSRIFQTQAAARRWVRFMTKVPYTKEVWLHRGQMGEELLDHIVKEAA